MGLRADTIIASSSSSIPSAKLLARCAKNPGRVLVGHPFNPPHLMPLVEVVPHPGTDPAVVERAMAFYRSLGKRPVHVRQEVPGFVVNRLQVALCNEAYSLVSRGIVSAAELGELDPPVHPRRPQRSPSSPPLPPAEAPRLRSPLTSGCLETRV